MRYTIIAALLSTTVHAATPAQIARAQDAVKLAQCKLEWLKSGNTNKLDSFRFIADCLAR